MTSAGACTAPELRPRRPRRRPLDRLHVNTYARSRVASVLQASGLLRRRCFSETKFDHVAVLHDVALALEANLAARSRLHHRSGGDELAVGDDLRLDEATLEVGVDNTRGLRSGCPLADRPGP